MKTSHSEDTQYKKELGVETFLFPVIFSLFSTALRQQNGSRKCNQHNYEYCIPAFD